MDMNLIELWKHMGLPVKGVVIVLTIQAIACLTVAIDRALLLFRARARMKVLVEATRPLAAARDYDGVAETLSAALPDFFASLLLSGTRAYREHIGSGLAPKDAMELVRRAVERRSEAVSSELSRGMNVLASTGSTAPFVGLLGTVLGIIHAFQAIRESNSGGLGTIGGAIGESLIVTGYGLVVAIPTVLLFNWLSNAIAGYERSLASTTGAYIDGLQADALGVAAASQTPRALAHDAASEDLAPSVN